MKIIAIMGSPRKGQTDRAINIFERYLRDYGEVEFDYIYLRELNLQACRGCGLCLMKGEEYCPLKDDRNELVEKLMQADGVIFATPNYSLQVSGLMKDFFDRLCYVFHRPCFFYKTSIAIVTQGVYGGNEIIKYINTVSEFWGFRVCKGVTLTTPWGVVNPKSEWPEPENKKIEIAVKKAAERFYKALFIKKAPEPSLKRLIIFRFARSAHKYSTEPTRDYEYFKDKGWFDSRFFYKTKLSWYKRVLGWMVDKFMTKQAEKAKKKNKTHS